jgi:ABC-2 type transport system ATP-binding protein
VSAIGVEALVKRYHGPPPVIAVDGVDLDVFEGQVFGLLGPNGAGKTTTVGVCTTRVRPSSGRVAVAGIDVVRDSPSARAVIGVVSQYNTLDRACNVRENLYYHCRYYGMGATAARARTAELLEQFRLGDRARAMPDQLSGGLAQRVQLARAIAHRPSIVFLDEPTAGLDPQSRLALWELIESMRSRGITVLLTTHYMEEADRLCDALAIMDHGRILASGTPDQLKRSAGGETMVDLRLDGEPGDLLAQLAALPSVTRASEQDGGVRLLTTSREGLLPRIVAVAGGRLHDLSVREPTLETVFLRLTGRELRD